MKKYPQILNEWENNAQPKIVLKVKSEEELTELYRKARENGLPCDLIVDAGRTQIAPGSKTVVGIGPGKLNS